eukprot:5705403-Amphidinium_carterae.1
MMSGDREAPLFVCAHIYVCGGARTKSSLQKWENWIKRYDGIVARGKELQGTVKVATLLAQIPKRHFEEHLLVNATRLKTYPDTRAEIENILRSQRHIGGNDPVPMDLGALGKGKCRHCCKTGHNENDIWSREGKGKGSGSKGNDKGKSKGKFAGKDKSLGKDKHADGRNLSS